MSGLLWVIAGAVGAVALRHLAWPPLKRWLDPNGDFFG